MKGAQGAQGAAGQAGARGATGEHGATGLQSDFLHRLTRAVPGALSPSQVAAIFSTESGIDSIAVANFGSVSALLDSLATRVAALESRADALRSENSNLLSQQAALRSQIASQVAAATKDLDDLKVSIDVLCFENCELAPHVFSFDRSCYVRAKAGSSQIWCRSTRLFFIAECLAHASHHSFFLLLLFTARLVLRG